jgi:rRNA maturation endonuclease Nob1
MFLLLLASLVLVIAIALAVLALRSPRERVVERQVVVLRCTFCSALTPIDASICEACGARSK